MGKTALAIALLYLLLPWDLLPDYFGWLGRIDDLFILITGYILFQKYNKRQASRRPPEKRGSPRPSADPGDDAEEKVPYDDPCAVLGVPRHASREEIKKAYWALMAQYHPDKVEHL